ARMIPPWMRRRRSFLPVRSAFATTCPIGGSGSTARSSSARSDRSSMTGLLLIDLDMRARGSGAWLGCDVIEQQAQLVQGASALALDVARRAAQQRSGLVDAQVRPVPQDYDGPCFGWQHVQGREHRNSQLRRGRVNRALRELAGEQLARPLL